MKVKSSSSHENFKRFKKIYKYHGSTFHLKHLNIQSRFIKATLNSQKYSNRFKLGLI